MDEPTPAAVTHQGQANPAFGQFARLCAENSSVGLVYFDRDANAVWINPAAARSFGLSQGDLPRLASHERRSMMLAEDGTPLAPHDFAPVQAIRTGRTIQQVFGLPTGAWFEASVQPVIDAGGAVNGAVMSVTDITAVRLARSELAKTEAMLSSVFAAMQEGVVVQKRGGAIIHANAAAERILGLTADQMSGRTSMDPRWKAEHEDGTPFPGETHPAMVALATGKPVRGVVMAVHRPADASRALIEINSEPLWSTAQSVTHAVTTFLDITKRRAAENELRAMAARVSDLYDRAPCGYHSLGPDGRYLEINQTELEWLGVSREDVIGLKSPSDFMTEESRETFPAHCAELRAGHETHGVECDIVRPGGGTRRVSVTASSVTAEDGRFLRTRSVMYDISDLHELRKALMQRTHEMESMLDNDVVAIARLRNRRFVWVNRAAAAMFGYEPQQMVGLSTRVTYPEDSAFEATGKSFYAQVRATGAFRQQTELVRKDGSRIWVDLYGAPLAGTDDALAFFADLTAIRNAQARMMEARRMESVGRLAGGVAHEFNNKLQTVLGISELALLDTGVSEATAQDFHEIQKAARHAADIARQLMAYAGKQHGVAEVTDLRSAVKARFPLLTPLLPMGVELALDANDAVWPVRIDPAQLTEALANLVMNAIESIAADGRVSIHVGNLTVDPERAERTAEGRTGDFVEILVRDTGVGMSPDVLKRACEPFFTTKRFGRNSGLGLSTVYGSALQNGGWLEISSEVGRGTAVSFLLPRMGAQSTPGSH
ncbi:MAG: PAS domain S-box protein [Vicinamibacterales bacterium]